MSNVYQNDSSYSISAMLIWALVFSLGSVTLAMCVILVLLKFSHSYCHVFFKLMYSHTSVHFLSHVIFDIYRFRLSLDLALDLVSILGDSPCDFHLVVLSK